MQIAVWMLSVDIDFYAIRGKHYGYQNTGAFILYSYSHFKLAPNSAPIDEAFALLKAAGHDPAGFKLYHGAHEAFQKAMDDYANDVKKLQALNGIGYFGTWPDAYAVLAKAFENHPGEEGASYRRMAVSFLFKLLITGEKPHRKVNARVQALFEAQAQVETDTRCRQDLERYLGWAEKVPAEK